MNCLKDFNIAIEFQLLKSRTVSRKYGTKSWFKSDLHFLTSLIQVHQSSILVPIVS